MENQKFEKLAKRVVMNYANAHVDKTDGVKVTEENVFIVWLSKVLQNNKALLSTTLPDGMYYEVTYNGDKDELYLDAYKKFENRLITGEEIKDYLEDIAIEEGAIEALAEKVVNEIIAEIAGEVKCNEN